MGDGFLCAFKGQVENGSKESLVDLRGDSL